MIASDRPTTAWFTLAALLAGCTSPANVAQASAADNLDKIKLPPGFAISLYAGNVENARSMALGAKGTLFVGTRQAGNVYAIVDRDRDYQEAARVRAERQLTRVRIDFDGKRT